MVYRVSSRIGYFDTMHTPVESSASARPLPVSTKAARRSGDDRSWLAAVLQRARERPDDLWLVQPSGGQVRTYTFGQAIDEARRIAAYLVGRHYPHGSAIAILSQNCAHFVLMDLAIWMAGHVTVPLYPTMPASTIRYVLDHCEARTLFIGKLPSAPSPASLRDGIDLVACTLSPSIEAARWEDIVATTAPLTGDPTRRPDELGAIIYTSGTTGRPKGVELEFGAMAAMMTGVLSLYDVGPEDRLISYLPLAHVAERSLVEGGSFATGARIYFCESLDTFNADVRRARPTVFVGVPRVWMKLREGVHAKIPETKLRRLLRMPVLGRMVRNKVLKQLGFDAVRYCGTGAAPCPGELLDFFAGLGIHMTELYGMTENFAYSHFDRPGQHRAGWIGPAMPGVEARIAGDGELQVKSPATMRGYHRDPEATAAAFTSDGFLRTGDKAELDPEGRVRIVGRTKEIFKTSKGKYVSPAEIENALLATGSLDQACVMGTGAPQPFAVARLADPAAPRDEARAPLEKLLADVNAARPPHERLSRLVIVDDPWTPESELLTPTFKLRREQLEARYAKRAGATAIGVSWLDPAVQ
jgi:long-chain acyl-CoA synthetase